MPPPPDGSDSRLRRLGNWRRGAEPRSLVQSTAAQPVAPDTTVQHLAEDDRGPQGMDESDDASIRYPVLGEIHKPREHALALVQYLLASGAQGKSLSVPDLMQAHFQMCAAMGWGWRKWAAIGRELKLMGLKTGTVTVGSERITYYQIEPVAEPASNVVSIERRA